LKALAILIFVISILTVSEVFAKECKYYRVRKGDSWWKIAKREGISIKSLRRANPRIGKYLKVGQRICIPVKRKAKKYKERYTSYIYYRVRRGDTLSEIAQKYGVSVKTLKRVNRLRSSKIYAGQLLKIPVARKGRRGDTLIKIARRFGVSYKKIMRINGLKSTRIRVPVKETVVIPAVIPKMKLDILPVNGRVERASHGINIYAPCGTEVRAVEDGRVMYAGDGMSNYGNLVILEHKGFMTLYAYNSEILVKEDQKVKKGDVIGRVGRRFATDDCHIRFEIRAMDGSRVNTLDYIGKNKILCYLKGEVK